MEPREGTCSVAIMSYVSNKNQKAQSLLRRGHIHGRANTLGRLGSMARDLGISLCLAGVMWLAPGQGCVLSIACKAVCHMPVAQMPEIKLDKCDRD